MFPMSSATYVNLRIVTFNCHSFLANQHIVTSILSYCDILMLQETLLSEVDSFKLGKINIDFDYHSVAATRKSDIFCGRSSGGLAILWRKTLGFVIDQHSHTDRIISIKLKQQNQSTLLMNVYCPCDYRNEESLLKYKSCMADISNILQEKNYDEVVISGDLNCDKYKGRFFVELHKLLSDFDLTAEDISQLRADSFTYVTAFVAQVGLTT